MHELLLREVAAEVKNQIKKELVALWRSFFVGRAGLPKSRQKEQQHKKNTNIGLNFGTVILSALVGRNFGDGSTLGMVILFRTSIVRNKFS